MTFDAFKYYQEEIERLDTMIANYKKGITDMRKSRRKYVKLLKQKEENKK